MRASRSSRARDARRCILQRALSRGSTANPPAPASDAGVGLFRTRTPAPTQNVSGTPAPPPRDLRRGDGRRNVDAADRRRRRLPRAGRRGHAGRPLRYGDPILPARPARPRPSPTTRIRPRNGPHYPVWANFQEFSGAVPDGNIVHNLEHGGVVLFYSYNPADPACAKVVGELRAVRDAITADRSATPRFACASSSRLVRRTIR